MVRFIYLYTLIKKGWNPDYTLRAQLLGCIEMTIGFTATCLPSIRVLWRSNIQYRRRRSQGSDSTMDSESTLESDETERTDELNADRGSLCHGSRRHHGDGGRGGGGERDRERDEEGDKVPKFNDEERIRERVMSEEERKKWEGHYHEEEHHGEARRASFV